MRYTLLMLKMCLNCGNGFEQHVEVDGIMRNLQRRRYCLECSPFGGGLRTRLPGDTRLCKRVERVRIVAFGQIVPCLICGREYAFNKRKGHQTSICNSCNANRKRNRVKTKAVEYKGGCCQQCGYSKCLRSLQFHHEDRSKKDFTIGGKMAWSWERLKVELDKCTLVCEKLERVPVVQR